MDLDHYRGTPNEMIIRSQLTAELYLEAAVLNKDSFGIYFEFFVLIFNWQLYLYL